MPDWPLEKKPLLLKGTLQDLMRVNPNTGEAQFIYRKAKHFEQIHEPNEIPIKPVKITWPKWRVEPDPIIKFLRKPK